MMPGLVGRRNEGGENQSCRGDLGGMGCQVVQVW